MTEITRGYLNMELLRFTTAGSVDDGKSTLIGRLLYDSKAIFEDQMNAIEEASERKGENEVNLALLTDGLRAEREQGITIDVQLLKENLLLLIHQVIFNIPVIW
jgi:sulfate adenylyltransferase subunit 1